MPYGYWRRNLDSLKRWLRSKRHKRFSASVDFVRSWRAKSRAAAVRVRCLLYCGARPLTLTLSPDGGRGDFARVTVWVHVRCLVHGLLPKTRHRGAEKQWHSLTRRPVLALPDQ